MPGTKIFNDILTGTIKDYLKPLVGILIGAICARLGISHTADMKDWSDWPIWATVLGIFILLRYTVGIACLAWARWRRRRAIRSPPGDRIALMIAELDGDEKGQIRQTIRESVRRTLGDAVYVVFWPECLVVGPGYEADEVANRTAQKWLKARSCDVLVWGRVNLKAISIRTTIADGKTTKANSYPLTDTFDLPTSALEALGAAVAARIFVASTPLLQGKDHYVSPSVRRLEKQLTPLIDSRLASFPKGAQLFLFITYVMVCHRIGIHDGASEHLLKAAKTLQLMLSGTTLPLTDRLEAVAQNDLAVILTDIADGSRDVELLDEAIELCRLTLTKIDTSQLPTLKAGARLNLARALTVRSRYSDDPVKKLREAADIINDQVDSDLRQSDGELWASTQNTRANIYSSLSQHENEVSNLLRSVRAYKSAIKVSQSQGNTRGWARATKNLSDAYYRLWQIKKNKTIFLECGECLMKDILSQEDFGDQWLWADCLLSFGSLLKNLGAVKRDAQRISAAISAYIEAMTIFTLTDKPELWAMCKRNQGNAVLELATLEQSLERVDSAISCHREAIKCISRVTTPIEWAHAKFGLGNALELRGRVSQDFHHSKEALGCFQDAHEVFTIQHSLRYANEAAERLNLIVGHLPDPFRD